MKKKRSKTTENMTLLSNRVFGTRGKEKQFQMKTFD